MNKVVYSRGRGSSKGKNYGKGSLVFDSFLTRIALLLISFFLLYNVFHSIKITIQKVDILQNARGQVEDLRLKNLELALMLEKMQDVEYLEVQARDRLNYSGEGEYVFVIPEEVLDSAGGEVDRILGVECEEREDPFDVWGEFLSEGI